MDLCVCVCVHIFMNISETSGSIVTKFYLKHRWVGGGGGGGGGERMH